MRRIPNKTLVVFDDLLAYYLGELAEPDRQRVEELITGSRRWGAHWQSIRFLDLERLVAMQDGEQLPRFDAITEYCIQAAQSEGRIFLEKLGLATAAGRETTAAQHLRQPLPAQIKRAAASGQRASAESREVDVATHEPALPAVSDETTIMVARATEETSIDLARTKTPAPRVTAEIDDAWEEHIAHCVFCCRLRRHVLAENERAEAGLPAGEVLLREFLLERYYSEPLTAALKRVQEVGLRKTKKADKVPVGLTADEEKIGELTQLARTAANKLSQRLDRIVPLLLEHVAKDAKAAKRRIAELRTFLSSTEVTQHLLSEGHVRDKLWVVVAEFCAQKGLEIAPPGDVAALLSWSVIDNVLWQTAVAEQQQNASEDEQAGLAAIKQRLKEQLATKDPEEGSLSLTTALKGFPRIKDRLRGKLFDQYATLLSKQ